MEAKLFDVKEINALVPQLNAAFSRVALFRQEISKLMDELRDLGFEPFKAARRELPDDPNSKDRAQRMYKLLDALRAEVELIEETGAILKDLEGGVLDFYGLREGRVVCLCWQHGEPEVMYWHEVESGFKGRQPLSEESIAIRRRLN